MNKIEINIPEGFEIDNEKSNFSKGIIEFKPVEKKKLNYEDVADKLFTGKIVYWNTSNGYTNSGSLGDIRDKIHPNNATSKEQLECLMAYNKLRNVAEYLNKDVRFNWNSIHQPKFYIFYNAPSSIFNITSSDTCKTSSVFFASKELAEEAINILGEEEIKKALFIY